MGRRSGGLGSWVGIGKMSLTLLAVAAMMALLASCGDTVYEAKGGVGGSSGVPTGTINISVKDGAGQSTFRNKADSVTVTLLNDPRNQGFPTSVLVDNGGVTFTGLVAGEYAVRISKPGYATSYIEGLKLQNEQDYNDKNQDYYYLRTVTKVEDLYPLTAGLKGTLLYKKADNTTGPAAGATVRIVINNEKLADNRNATVTTDASGTFTFTDLPATGDADYTITALSKDFDGLLFVDSDLPAASKKALRSGVTTTIVTTEVYNTPVTGLRWTKAPISVEQDEAVVVKFNENVEASSISSKTVVVTDNDVEVSRDVVAKGDELTISPHGKWSGKGNLEITFAGLLGSSGGGVAGSQTVRVVVSYDNNKLIVVNADESGVIWLDDSTKSVVLVFNKEIDEVATASANNLINESYHLTVDGTTLTLAPAAGAWVSKTPILNLTGVTDITGGTWTAANQLAEKLAALSIKTNTDGTPDFAVVKTGAWVDGDINIGLADTAKALEINLSADLGTPKASEPFRVYLYKGASPPTAFDPTVLTNLNATFAGNKITLAANPRWSADGNIIIFENIISSSGKKLVGSETHGYGTSYAAVKAVVVERAPFYVLTASIELPADYKTVPLNVLFSQPIDPEFLSGKVTVAGYKTVYIPGTPPSSFGSQLADATLSADGRTVTLKPQNGTSWISQYLSFTFNSNATNGMKSVEGKPLETPNAPVFTTWSEASTDVSTIKVAKFWLDETDPLDLRSSGATSVNVNFVLARDAKDQRIGCDATGGVPCSPGWTVGSYLIEGVANGAVVSSDRVDAATVGWKVNRDTVTVPVSTGFTSSPALGGKEIQYYIQPSIGSSRGVSVANDETVSGWILLTNAQVGGIDFEDGDWDGNQNKYDPAAYFPAGQTTTYGSTADVQAKLAAALSLVEYWGSLTADIPKEGTKSKNVTSKQWRNILNLKFSEEISEELVVGTLYWRNPRKAVSDLVVVDLVRAADFDLPTKVFSYDVYLSAANYTSTSWKEVVDAILDESTPSGGSKYGKAVDFDKINLTLSNIGNVGTGSKFGIAYEARRNRVDVAEEISIDILDISTLLEH